MRGKINQEQTGRLTKLSLGCYLKNSQISQQRHPWAVVFVNQEVIKMQVMMQKSFQGKLLF